MASIWSSQSVVLATAMVAVSGTVIFLAFRLQKSFALHYHHHQIPLPSQQVLRSCISSEGKNRWKKKKKKVLFAEDVMDPKRENGEELRIQVKKNPVRIIRNDSSAAFNPSSPKLKKLCGGGSSGGKGGRMPANRVALYNGMLRDRVVQRLAYYSC